MGFMDRARAAARAFSTPAAVDAAGPSAAADGLNDPNGLTVLNILGPNGRGAPTGEAEAMSVPAIFRALETLCGTFAMTPMVYYRRDGEGKVRAANNPLFKLFHDRPNDTQNIFLFKELMLGDLLMKGRFGSYIHRDTLYRPSALSRVNPDGIATSSHWNREAGAELFWDVHLPDGTRDRLTRNDFWYMPGFSRNGVTGIDRLKVMDDMIYGAQATSTFAARFWENNAQPSTILTTKGKVDATEKSRIKTDWQNRFSGARNAGGVAVLDQEMTAQFLSQNNKESQYIETRTFYILEVARAFGVPPHLLYELSRATFSNIEHQQLAFITMSMVPHYERVAAAANHQFAEEGHFFEFMPDALLKGDIKSRYEAYAIAVDKGVLNPNEVRRKENMNDRDGGDEYRVGSGSAIEGQQASAPSAPPPALDEDEEDEE